MYKRLVTRIPRYWNHALRIERTLREVSIIFVLQRRERARSVIRPSTYRRDARRSQTDTPPSSAASARSGISCTHRRTHSHLYPHLRGGGQSRPVGLARRTAARTASRCWMRTGARITSGGAHVVWDTACTRPWTCRLGWRSSEGCASGNSFE